MSLTRKMLSAMEIEPEKVSQIIDGHTETVNALQSEIDTAKAEAQKYKADAEKLQGVQKELDDLKKDAEKKAKESADYEALKHEFENYKAEQEKKAADEVKRVAFKELLSDMKISDNGIAQILKWQGVDGVEMDEDGKIANAKDLRKSVKEDWGDYIVESNTQGTPTPTPPANNATGNIKTKDEIMGIRSASERQRLIAENLAEFGKN